MCGIIANAQAGIEDLDYGRWLWKVMNKLSGTRERIASKGGTGIRTPVISVYPPDAL